MIQLELEKVKKNTAVITIIPETKVKPIIGIYHVQSDKLTLYKFKKEIEKPTEVLFITRVPGNYVVFVGILEDDTVYVTDIDSFVISEIPTFVERKEVPKYLRVIVPLSLAGFLLLIKYFMK